MLESLFNKVTGLEASNFIKKGLQHRCFPVNIAKFLRIIASLKVCNFVKKRPQHRCFPVNIAKFKKKKNLKNICERLLQFFLTRLSDLLF